MKRFVWAVVLAGCGAAEVPKAVEPLDLRNALPAASARYFDVLGGEQVIAAGSEKMFCTDVVYEGEDVAYDALEATQGKFGHHAVLLVPVKPRAPGTVTDCTDASTMKDFSLFAIGQADVPKGHGGFLPKGKQLVIQSHYVNTGKVPIRVRDVLRIRTMPIAEVTTWMGVFVNTTDQIDIPPHAMGFSTTFDCPVTKDLALLVLGGHMHEWGARMEVSYVAPDGALTPVYKIDQWKAEYRDTPPVDLYTSKPRELKGGGQLRITCAWNNTSDQTLKFPSEMCVLFGYAAGTKEPIVCGGATL